MKMNAIICKLGIFIIIFSFFHSCNLQSQQRDKRAKHRAHVACRKRNKKECAQALMRLEKAKQQQQRRQQASRRPAPRQQVRRTGASPRQQAPRRPVPRQRQVRQSTSRRQVQGGTVAPRRPASRQQTWRTVTPARRQVQARQQARRVTQPRRVVSRPQTSTPQQRMVRPQKDLWRSTEHFFQAYKFVGNQDIFSLIRNQTTPRDAFQQARQQRGIRPDWENIKFQIMLHAVYYKFLRNEELKQKLLATRDAYLIEDSPVDSLWGIGADRSGQNYLGKVLIYVRECLRTQSEPRKFMTAAELKQFLDTTYPIRFQGQVIYFYDRNKPYYEFTNFYMLPGNKLMDIPSF